MAAGNGEVENGLPPTRTMSPAEFLPKRITFVGLLRTIELPDVMPVVIEPLVTASGFTVPLRRFPNTLPSNQLLPVLSSTQKPVGLEPELIR